MVFLFPLFQRFSRGKLAKTTFLLEKLPVPTGQVRKLVCPSGT